MSNFGLSCDVCGREVQGYTLVNGMKFCAKCYQETFGDKNMTENLNNMYEAYLKILNEKDQRIAELEEQLAEKEKEYQSFKKIADENVNYLKNIILEETKNYNEKKITFAVEQLEKVKEFLAKRKEDYWYLENEMKAISYSEYIGFVHEVETFELKVDDQIKQLKEME